MLMKVLWTTENWSPRIQYNHREASDT